MNGVPPSEAVLFWKKESAEPVCWVVRLEEAPDWSSLLFLTLVLNERERVLDLL
jgi:hypothetical protein